jgi:RimJ/RimL family protein N-acetyltransferase
MPTLRLQTSRLDLVSSSLRHVLAELEGRPSLVRELRSNVPDSWPPEHYDTEALEVLKSFFEKNPDTMGWNPWYILLRGEMHESPTAIGVFGFKGRPSQEGEVEIGYSILPEYQRKGYGTEAIGAFVSWAFSHEEVDRIVAETFPELNSSIRVLEKNGFQYAGPGSGNRILRYVCQRKDLQEKRRPEPNDPPAG